MFAYGVLLIGSGLLGFEITSEHSSSSLVNGIVGGALMVVLSAMHRQRRQFTLPAAFGAAGIFCITFVWRATIQWMLIGTVEFSLWLTVLHTVLTVVSAAMVLTLFRQLR